MVEGAAVGGGCGAEGIPEPGAQVGAAAQTTPGGDLLHLKVGDLRQFPGPVEASREQPLVLVRLVASGSGRLRGMYWACPPSRCGEATSSRAILLAMAAPRS